MHDYMRNRDNDRSSVQPKVKHMPPAQEQVDPRLMAMALEELKRGSMPPMSSGDSVTITITPEDAPIYASNYEDPRMQQQSAYNDALMQHQRTPYQAVMQDEMANALIRERAAEILQYAMGRGMQSSIDGSHRPFIPPRQCG